MTKSLTRHPSRAHTHFPGPEAGAQPQRPAPSSGGGGMGALLSAELSPLAEPRTLLASAWSLTARMLALPGGLALPLAWTRAGRPRLCQTWARKGGSGGWSPNVLTAGLLSAPQFEAAPRASVRTLGQQHQSIRLA